MDEFKTTTYPNGDIGNEDIGCSTHPHNIFLQIFVEYGLVGICLYLLIFYKIISQIYLNILQYNRSNLTLFKNTSLSLSFLYLTLFLNIFPFIPSGNFFNNWLSIILFLPIGFILSIEKK
jgi:O-antigen ligase